MTANKKNGRMNGGAFSWEALQKSKWNIEDSSWNYDSKTPYIWNPCDNSYLAFESVRSLKAKIKYATSKNIGGLAVFRFDSDDDKNTMLNTLSSGDLCSGDDNTSVKYECD
ncbi:hypothetical protein B9Z55_018209 [Caenorhabditis nigoni]|uniref:GH18 domain-containing protein n=2 Tax=Caenorhabditis nigoni TaxID=1611254 RepID=A0A2G5TD34_9PELO|nr:hypothetical protein B9Z55_018209 [Caenorhabditis nigoni]